MVKISNIISIIVASSMLIFSLRGKFGAAVITLLILILVMFQILNNKLKISYCLYYSLFIVVFAVVSQYFRSSSFEYYLWVGYIAVSVILLNQNIEIYNKLWDILGGISIIQALGIYIQWLLPSIYYSVISIFLPSSVVMSIKNRMYSGYYTGFSREVSYTMFFIVVGLGIYFFDVIKYKDGIFNGKIKKYSTIMFLFGSLLLSGKRATLIFFIISIFVIKFIDSRDRLKLLKYMLMILVFFIVVYVTYPLWSKIPSLTRINELIEYVMTDNLIGITNGRVAIYEKAVDLWKTSPIFGIGWGNFKYAVSETLWYSGFDVHNCYLQVLCETGIVGAVIYYGLILFAVYKFIKCIIMTRNCRDNKIALLAGFIQLFFCIYSVTEPILYEYTDYILFFVSINITSILIKDKIAITKGVNK